MKDLRHFSVPTYLEPCTFHHTFLGHSRRKMDMHSARLSEIGLLRASRSLLYFKMTERKRPMSSNVGLTKVLKLSVNARNARLANNETS
jgi:hypothetical protein